MMSDVKVRRIHQLADKETTKIVDMCLRAYEDNPAVPAMTGNREELRDLLFRAMIRPGATDGELYVAETDDDGIVSMAMWFPPGHTIWSSEEQRSLGYDELMKRLDDDTRDWWKNIYGPHMAAFLKKMLPTSQADSWWLSVLGTDPDHQHKGYASLLINHVLDKIKAPNLVALCTTSDDNASFYNGLGFTTQGRTQVPSKAGLFPVICLSRIY